MLSGIIDATDSSPPRAIVDGSYANESEFAGWTVDVGKVVVARSGGDDSLLSLTYK